MPTVCVCAIYYTRSVSDVMADMLPCGNVMYTVSSLEGIAAVKSAIHLSLAFVLLKHYLYTLYRHSLFTGMLCSIDSENFRRSCS